MSYVIDVYRREWPSQRNPVNIALYISLFPQLIAGPIVRYHDIAAHLVSRTVDLDDAATGIRRFCIGLAKKVLIANVVGQATDQIFALKSGLLAFDIAWLGLICYTLQIYFDFSGYSDMAIGLGRIFGLRFLENFNYPYISQSITEFWRRWHISLSRWFRDYLYVPIGGSRRGRGRTYFNLVTVFFLCGLWHGASWNFVIWGFFHGSFLVVERMGLTGVIARVPRLFRHAYVLMATMIGWVFFRAETLPGAWSFLGALLGTHGWVGNEVPRELYLTNDVVLAIVFGAIGSTPILTVLDAYGRRLARQEWRGAGVFEGVYAFGRVVFPVCLFLLSTLRLSSGAYNPFIYFRF